MKTEDTCRLCLEKIADSGSSVSLWNDSLQTEIKRVFPFQFNRESHLPAYACILCSQRVWEFSSYSEFVENNQRKLQRSHPLALSADNAQKDVCNEQLSGSIVEEVDENSSYDSRRAPIEENYHDTNEQISCELRLDIEVGKYELQEQQNEENVRINNGIELTEDEAEYAPAFSIHSINQSYVGSKQNVNEKPKSTDSAYESPKTVHNVAGTDNVGRPFISVDSAVIRKNISSEIEFFGGIEIDDIELLELENEELESTTGFDEPTLNVQRITEPEEELKNTPKNNESKNWASFSCGQFKQKFTAHIQFDQHVCREPLSDSSNNSSFPCDLCERTFLSYKQCMKHRYSHKTAQCPICAKQIRRKNINQHIAAHEGIFRCDICGRHLSSSWKLRSHHNTFHSDTVK